MIYRLVVADLLGKLLMLACLQPGLLIAQDTPPVPVDVVQVGFAPMYEEIPLTGSVTTPRLSRISPNVSGLVAEVLADAGDKVNEDDPLLQLDNIMARIELDRAGAELNEARARLKEAKRQRDETEQLLKNKHIASTSYEASVAEVEINEATVARLEAALTMQQEILDRHTVYAPFDGSITSKQVETGEWVDTRTILFELASTDILRVEIPVPQYYFNQVDIGTPISIRLDSLPDRVFKAHISMKVPMGSAAARTFPLLADIHNTEGVVAPGMSARVRLMLKQSGQMMLLPRDAIIKKPHGSELVWVLRETNGQFTAISMPVQTGRSFRGNVEIVDSPLNNTDRVVVRGNETLTEGQKVWIAEEIKLDLQE
jgi:RND family efflux transporter MFP subunit